LGVVARELIVRPCLCLLQDLCWDYRW